jgi:hypothetical protein
LRSRTRFTLTATMPRATHKLGSTAPFTWDQLDVVERTGITNPPVMLHCRKPWRPTVHLRPITATCSCQVNGYLLKIAPAVDLHFAQALAVSKQEGYGARNQTSHDQIQCWAGYAHWCCPEECWSCHRREPVAIYESPRVSWRRVGVGQAFTADAASWR